MVPGLRLTVPAPAGCRARRGAAVLPGLCLLVVVLLALSGAGCSWFTVDDRELATRLGAAAAAIDSGAAATTIHGLDKLAWHRRDSITARVLLVEACRQANTIESRRIAERALRELVALDPDNPDYRFQLAELLLERGFDRDARGQLDRVLERNPDHPGGHLALARYHLALYRRFRMGGDYDELLGHFARAANLAPDDYAANRGLAEAYMLGGRWQSALELLERLHERWPRDGWLWALSGACRARPGSYPEASTAFARAFDLLPERERAPFEDLQTIASPYELGHFDMMVPDEREDFLRVFWRSKDPMPVTPVNEREIEHWRRVVMADLMYAVPRFDRRGWETARGELLIRYGEPLYTEYIEGSRALFFSIPGWFHVYAAADGELPVTFYDMTLNGLFYLPFTQLPTASDLAAYEMPQSYAHDYGGRWITPAMATGGFKAGGGRTRAEVYLALSTDSLAVYQGTTLATGAVAFDPEWNEVARVEEIVDLDAAPIAGHAGRALVHQMNFDLRPGPYILASQIEGDAGAIVGTTTREIEVPPFGDGAIALSMPELAFAASASGPERFTKGGINVVPNATGEVRGPEQLVLYFEIYNLARSPGAEGRGHYSIRYRITPADREGKSVFARIADAFTSKTFIESRFIEQSADDVVRRHLTIDVSTLAADRYRLELEVGDLATGAVARRELHFRRSP